MKLFNIGTSKRKSLDEEYVSKQGRKSDKTKPMFDDSDFVEPYMDNAMENVKGDAKTQGRNTIEQITINGDTVNSTSIDVSVVGPSNVSTTDSSTSTVGDIFEDEMMTIADTLVSIRSTRPRTTSVVIRDVEEEPRRATPIPTVQRQDNEIAQRLFEEDQAQFEREQMIARERAAEQEARDATLIEQMEDIQARMDADKLLAERIQQEEREQFTIKEKSRMMVKMIAKRKRFFATQRAEQIRKKPPTRAQLRNKMVTYLKHMGKYTHNQMKSKSFKEIQKLYEWEQKWTNDFVPIDFKVVKDSKKGKAEGSRKKTVARKIPGEKLDDESVKRQKIEDEAEKGALRAYLDIISGDDEAVNVESLATKYPIVDWKTHALSKNKMYYKIIKGDGNLITVFEPSEDDDIWKAQQDYTLISWRLFDSCGVHVLLMDTGIAIHMLIEKTYPLTQEMLSRMLSRRLEVDHECEMAYELLRGGLLGIRGFYDLMLLVQVCAAAED
ncbi:hypothetical protein Tco_1355140 [Tanacetum coccineum]